MKEKIFRGLKGVMVFSVAVMIALSFVATASATNGYFSHGYSIKNKALAGAGTALPLDSLAASTNPAGMAFVGNRIDIGVSFFNPNREYKVSGTPDPPPALGLVPRKVESGSKWFVIPVLGANWMINENSSLGLSIYGNGGMNTDYDKKVFYGSSPTGVDLMQLFVVPTYALKLNPKHAIGISPIFAYQRFEARGLQAFGQFGLSSDPGSLTNNNHDSSYGYGGRIGYQGEVLPGLHLGASYQTRIYMNEFDKYAGLFAEDGDFDIPQNWSIGLAYNATTALTLVFDVQKIYYSDIKSINNPLTATNLTPGSLGKGNGPGFGWEDMTVYKFGVQWQSGPEWTWRAGYSIGDQPIPDSEVLFNILAPGVIEQHATAGVTKKIGSNQEVDFALMHAFSHEISGKNTLDPSQTIKLKMNQWEISAGYSYKF
jgi:long-chain fatty acid transport protein